MAARKTKDELIRARVSQEEKRVLFEAAHKCGMTLSDFLRVTAEKAARKVAA
ncbi:plasmid mobilization protein [Aerobium aerolatum]|uniref:DUF1778 domain-containing protein n=1 Tax=Aquamicrobium aerolatum DSM 21857 TaxID=1121003 RepID=A0A1I3SS59_9HYPH|nr:DUF1778 domain-containing protein [Aquamicrobium aerolatum]SFJ61674.1 Protein of unknown function [Aquamicrobium aerolatum DSM 21857]